MNTLKKGCQENVNRNQQRPWQMGICEQEMEVGSQQESYDQQANSSSSSTIMHRIGSPASAFYAAEKYMGFSQYDHQPASNPILVSKKFEPPISLYQQSGNGYYGDPSFDQVGTGFQAKRARERPQFSSIDHYNSSYEKVFKTPCNIVSEREKILELKRKLLDDYDSSDTRQLSSFSYDGNHDLSISENVYGSQHAHVRPIGRPSGPFSVNSASSGAVIESKTRIRWTQELHDQFVECVNCLGGAEKATPKAILKLMDSEGLTIFHVKSHLQKYRIAKYMPESAKGKTDKRTSMSSVEEIDNKTGMQIKEALQMQLDVQRRLHEQLEIQRNLQLRIEEQGRQLKMMLDQQQKTTKSFMETQNSENTSPEDQQSTSLEDVQVLINVEDFENTNFPSKIS